MVVQLTDIQRDMFKEIGNVGVGNASTALSTMINKQVSISLPDVQLVDRESMISDDGKELLIVNSKLHGDLKGNLLVIYNKDTAFPLIDLLLSQPKGTLLEISDMAKSVFKEMVNIIAGPYLDSLSEMANLRLMPEPPTFSYGRLVSIKDGIMAELPPDAHEVIYVKEEMRVEGELIFGNIYLVLDAPSLTRLLELLSGDTRSMK